MNDSAERRRGERGPSEPQARRWWRRSTPLLAEPQVSYVGPVAIWWIPKPRGPRISVRGALIVWVAALPIMLATMVWAHAASRSLWPFGHRISSPAEVLLRYELILLVCLVYVTLRSLPRWVRYHRLARRDAVAIEKAIRARAWELAALLVHRYWLLGSAVWPRVPTKAAAWDSVLRPRLPGHRRLYLYYRAEPPQVPPDATASFTPEIVPPPRPSLWWAATLIPIAVLLYLLVVDVLRTGYAQRLILFNAVLLAVILLSYGFYFLTALLGRSHYFRFAPGVVQLVNFRLGRRRPAIETFDLRGVDAVLDLSAPWPAVILLNTPGYRSETFRLPGGDDVIEALLRASLSTAPRPPLPEGGLLE